MKSHLLEWVRGVVIWSASLGLYLWFGGESLRLIWWVSTILLVGGALISLSGPTKITISHTGNPSCIQEGDSVEVTVRVTYRSILPLPWLVITDQFGGRVYRKLLFPGMRRRLEYTYRLHHVPRGIWSPVCSKMEWGDLFGWFRRSRGLQGAGSGLIVLPRPLEWPEAMMPAHGSELDMEADRSNRNVWNEMRGSTVRDYIPGDPMNRIHWKNSAKVGRLQSFMPHESCGSRQGIVLDTSFDAYEGFQAITPENAFEDTVSAAAGLVSRLIRSRTPYQLWMNGKAMQEQAEFKGNLKEMEDTWLPLASVQLTENDSKLWNQPEFKESLRASHKNTDWAIITGGFHQGAANMGIQLLNAGSRKVTIFCTENINWSKASGQLSTISSERLVLPVWAQEFFGKGGKLVYLHEGPAGKKPMRNGGAGHDRAQRLAH